MTPELLNIVEYVGCKMWLFKLTDWNLLIFRFVRGV